ncbi:MAG: class I SAM-dependent methyltransferase [Gammaproteobacteria bacterium]
MKRIHKVLAILFRRFRVKKLISILNESDDTQLKAVSNALYGTINKSLSDDERLLIEAIERRRYELLDSEELLNVQDYGAGNSTSSRTQAEMDQGVHCTVKLSDVCKASKRKFWALFLYKLVRNIKPLSCVELGTCVGISASYQATALKLNGNNGRLVTLEGSDEVALVAVKSFESLDLQNVSVVVGPFHKTLADTLKKSGPIDYFFNDGHHDHDAVLRYFHESLPHLSTEAVIVFDDISWSPGMRSAWEEIKRHSRIRASVDLGDIGIALISDSPVDKMHFKAAL